MRTGLRLWLVLNAGLIVLVALSALKGRPRGSQAPAASEVSEPATAGLDPAPASPDSGPPPPLRQSEVKSSAALAAEAAAAAADSPRLDAADGAVSMPLVLQEVDWEALNLDAGQREAIADLRQRFLEAIGGPDQDPSDPAYRARWLHSQPESDNLLRGMIGVRAWQDYQIAARSRR